MLHSRVGVALAAGAFAFPAAAMAADCPGSEHSLADVPVAEFTGAVGCLINDERAQRGRSAVIANVDLARAAGRHAGDMVERRYFAHVTPGGSTFVDRLRRTGYIPTRRRWLAGEILAWASGSRVTPRRIVDVWLASPPHRRMLLDPRYAEVGVAVTQGSPMRHDPTAATAVAEFARVR